MQEMDTPGDLLVIQGDCLRSTLPAEAPTAVHSSEQDLLGPSGCSQDSGTDCGNQIPKEDSKFSFLPKTSSNEGANAEEPQAPEAESTMEPSKARIDKGDDTKVLGLKQDKGPAAENLDPGKDYAACGEREEAGKIMSLGTEAETVVLGKWSHCCFSCDEKFGEYTPRGTI